MGFGKSVIGLLTAVFLAAAVLLGGMEYSRTQGLSLSVTVSTGERIRCWQDEEGAFYAFLPGGTELSGVVLHPSGGTDVRLDGNPVTDGMTAAGFLPDKAYSLTCRAGGEEKQTTLTFLLSGGVPALYVDTASGSVEYIRSGLGNEESGALRLYSPEGQKQQELQIRSINSRGNATYAEPKGAYSITLSREADLLDMGQAEKWILLANAGDQTHLRNKIALDLAREAGLPYTPEGRWVDLYLNGEYTGLYLLTERNEVHPSRVDIAAEGSFLVEKDWQWRFDDSGERYITTRDNTALQINYSSFTETELLAKLQSAENAILAEDGIDPDTGKHWQELIDMDTWVKKYLVEEILGNVDASTLSQFFYLDGADPAGKICAGPIWDMDLILRESTSPWLEKVDQFYGNKPRIYGSGWFAALYRDAAFYERLTEVYKETFLPLLNHLAQQGVDDYVNHIGQAAMLDGIRWSEYYFENHCALLRSYLDKRLAFLDRLWVQQQPYVNVVVYDADLAARSVVIPRGTCLPELPVYENTDTTIYHGWYYWDTDIPFDITLPVYEDAEIQLRYETVAVPEEPVPSAPLSRLQLLPGAAFAVMLCLVCGIGLRMCKPKEKQLQEKS